MDKIITVTKVDGTLAYEVNEGGVAAPNDGSSVQVKPSEKVFWTSPDGHISIIFKKGRSPFSSKRRTVAADEDDLTDDRTVRKLKQVEKPNPKFEYTVVHIDDHDNLVSEDPDLIVDDPGGGDGG